MLTSDRCRRLDGRVCFLRKYRRVCDKRARDTDILGAALRLQYAATTAAKDTAVGRRRLRPHRHRRHPRPPHKTRRRPLRRPRPRRQRGCAAITARRSTRAATSTSTLGPTSIFRAYRRAWSACVAPLNQHASRTAPPLSQLSLLSAVGGADNLTIDGYHYDLCGERLTCRRRSNNYPNGAQCGDGMGGTAPLGTNTNTCMTGCLFGTSNPPPPSPPPSPPPPSPPSPPPSPPPPTAGRRQAGSALALAPK